MREIKFRAWDKKEKIMKNRVVVGCDFEFDRYKTSVYELKPFKNSINSYPNENLIPMQYTGLKDKNEKEVYEGDIIKYMGGIGKVVFIDGCYFVENKDTKNAVLTLMACLDINNGICIGNIYENKELLNDNI